MNEKELPEPNSLERRMIKPALERLETARGVFQVKYDADAALVMSPHSDRDGYFASLAAALGTTSSDFVTERINEIASVVRGKNKKPKQSEMNAAFALIDGYQPQNELEATLLVQMATTHSAAMQALLTANGDLRLATDGGVGNLAIKLLRTFTMQVEALTKLRRGGEQVVRHIHVDNRGGQAVIAEIVNQGGANGKSADQSHTAAATVGGPALLSEDASWHGVPIPGGERKKAVPNARRQRRRAEGE